MHIVDFVNFDQVFKKHKDQIWKQACLSAEARISELCEDLRHDFIEEACILEDLRCGELGNVVWYAVHSLRKNVGFVGNNDIDLYVVAI